MSWIDTVFMSVCIFLILFIVSGLFYTRNSRKDQGILISEGGARHYLTYGVKGYIAIRYHQKEENLYFEIPIRSIESLNKEIQKVQGKYQLIHYPEPREQHYSWL